MFCVGIIEVTGGRGRRRKQFLNDLRDRREYWKLEKETLICTVRRIRFGRGCRPVARQCVGLIVQLIVNLGQMLTDVVSRLH
jgi:hypothetical protein